MPESEGPLTDEDGEVRELTDENFFSHARPTRELFPDLDEKLARARGQRGPQKTPTKERVTLRLDRAVVESYRADGPGWQTRINDDLARLQKRKKHA